MTVSVTVAAASRLTTRAIPGTLRRMRTLSLVAALSLVSLLALACAEDPAPAPSNPGGVGSGGAPAGGLPDLSGCTVATATDGTTGAQTVSIPASKLEYTPKCLKVKVGTVVTFEGSGILHPLAPGSNGTAGNPIPSSKEASVAVTFAAAGAFSYYCANHGADGATSGMVGAVYVVP